MLYYKMLQAIKGKIGAAIINDDGDDCYVFVYDLTKLDGKNIIEDRVYDEGQLENVIDMLRRIYNIDRRDIKEIDKSESLFHHEYTNMEIYKATIKSTGNILRLESGGVQTYYMYVLDCYNGDIIKKYTERYMCDLYSIAKSKYNINQQDFELIDKTRYKIY